MLFALTPAALIAIAALAFAFKFVRPAPPDTLVMTTGAPEGAYHAYAQKYRAILARDQVKLDLRLSAGSMENLKRLADEQRSTASRECSRSTANFPFRAIPTFP